MKAMQNAYLRFLAGVWQDAMLAACMAAPIFMGAAFRLGLPLLEGLLCRTLACTAFLAPYYRLFDLLLAVMTPIMFAFSGVMTILEETDNGTARAMMVTPLGKSGYLFSRIGLSALLATGYAALLLAICGLSGMGGGMILAVSALSSLFSIVVSMLVVAFAHNKVEGMALIKLSGILIFGLPAVFFVAPPARFLAGVLPSFWMAELAVTGQWGYLVPALLCCGVWGAALYRRFAAKLL
ncbi:MAG: ABC transporter permease [Faecalibacterium sp.]|jgi:fluoroquinolone transport system permease protein|nr:ABC transporter permease [Faecalibacterium sp.]